MFPLPIRRAVLNLPFFRRLKSLQGYFKIRPAAADYGQCGKEEGSDDPRMILQHAEILDDVISQTAGGIMIVIDRAEAVEPLKNTIGDLRPGRSRVLFAVLADKWEVEIVCEKTYALTADVLSALPKIQGVSEVREL